MQVRPELTLMEHLLGSLLCGGLLALLVNNRSGCKGLPQAL